MTEVAASHCVYLFQPAAVATLIKTSRHDGCPAVVAAAAAPRGGGHYQTPTTRLGAVRALC